MQASIITLLSDFGLHDCFAGIMKGVILGIAPHVRLVDLTHAVPAQDVLSGALQLRSAVAYFPAATVHLAVVDPGVGSGRQAIAIETDNGVLVGPDNGLLSLAASTLRRRRAHRIENTNLLRHPVSQTFHGRDVFAPVAAHLACGVAIDRVGPAVDSIVELALPQPRAVPGGLAGEVLYIDAFGNLITNIDVAAIHAFPAQILCVSIAAERLSALHSSYSDVPEGALLAVIGSWGLLEIAVRNGNAARQLGVRVGTPVTAAWALST